MQIETLKFNDYNNLQKLSLENNLNILPKINWEKIWTNNPYYLNNKDQWPIGWKLINENKKLVGAIINIPFIFNYNEENFLGAVCGNWVVDNQYQSYSLKLRSKFLNQDNVDMLITNTANLVTQKVMEAFKAKKISQINYEKKLIHILNKKNIILSYIKGGFFKKNFFYDLINFFLFIFKKKKKYKFNCRNEIAHDFAIEFDKLNNELKKNKPMFSLKDCNWLRWKYARLINTKKIWIIKTYVENKFVGFVALLINENDTYNMKKSTIVEISYVNSEKKKLISAIEEAVKISKRLNCDFIEIVGFNEEKRNHLKKIGFLEKNINNQVYIVKNNNNKVDNIFFNESNISDLSLTDGDAIFNL